MPHVTIIIATHNSARYLDRCLDAVAVQDYADFETIVVDSGSTDASALVAKRREAPGLRAVALGRNLGFAVANNEGAALAHGRWLATLNPDAFPRHDWLSSLVSATRRHPEAAMFGSTQLDAADGARLDGCGDCYHPFGLMWRGGHGWTIDALPAEGEVFSPCAAAALWRRDEFLAAGGFDARYFCYCEDVDLGFRLRMRGHRCIQVAGAVVEHVGAGSSGGNQDFMLYHGTRNRVWVFAKNMPWPLLLVMAPAHVAAAAAFLAGALYRGHARPVARGLRDALLKLPEVWSAREATGPARAWAVMQAMTWRLGPLLRRAPDVRPSAPLAAQHRQ